MNTDKKHARRRLEGARRAMAMPADESPQGTASPRPAVIVPPDPEVVATPTRRRFTAEDTLRIRNVADACTAVGSLGALLRAEGLYASTLTTWRRQRTEGVLSALTPQKRGRKASVRHPLRAENETLRKENARLATQLKQAELMIDVQKKVSEIRGLPLETPEEGGRAGWPPRGHCPRRAALSQPVTPSASPGPGSIVGRDLRRCPPRVRAPPRTVSSEERHAVLATLHSDRFIDTAPAAVYATLLDEGRYHCSIRTLYRILDEQAEVKERRNQLRHPVYQKPELLATAPNQVWSWDITKLLGPVKGSSCYLSVILDIFSRDVVGWMIAPAEPAGLAQRLIKDPCEKQQIGTGPLPLHADRGSSMTSKPVAWLLADLGGIKTHS